MLCDPFRFDYFPVAHAIIRYKTTIDKYLQSYSINGEKRGENE